MYYGYPLKTKYGWVPAYDNELNLPPSLPPGMLVSLHQPSPQMQGSGRALMVYPVSSSPDVITFDGKRVTVAEMGALEGRVIGATQNGTPVIVGPVVPIQQTTKQHMIQPIAIDIPGHSPGIIAAIIFLIIAIVVYYTIANLSWATVEQAKYEAHKYDVVAQSQEIDREWVEDLNGDGIPDIRNIIWKNGEYVQAAMSDYGFSLLGGTAQTITQGIDWGELVKQIENDEAEQSMWEGISTCITVAVAGGAIFMILRYGLPAVLPPKKGRPQVYLPFEKPYPTQPFPAAARPVAAATPPPLPKVAATPPPKQSGYLQYFTGRKYKEPLPA